MNKIVVAQPARSRSFAAGQNVRHFVTRTRNTLMLVAAGATGLAGAQTDPLADLNTKATSGTGTIVATVGTIAGVALTVALIIWGVRHLKPKG